MRRRYRGRRAGRIVQSRRLRAIHRQDYDRALIPLTDPGLAPGIEESPAVQTRGRPGLTADGCQEGSGSDSFRRVESYLPLQDQVRNAGETARCLAVPTRLTARQTDQYTAYCVDEFHDSFHWKAACGADSVNIVIKRH